MFFGVSPLSEHKLSRGGAINGVSRISEVGGEAGTEEKNLKIQRVDGSSVNASERSGEGRGGPGGEPKQVDITIATQQRIVEIIDTLRPPPERPIDEVWDQLVLECGATTEEMTKSERGRYNRAVRELKEVGATPKEISQRAAIYRSTYPNLHVTPNALVVHWSRCKPAPAPTVHVAATFEISQGQRALNLEKIRELRGQL